MCIDRAIQNKESYIRHWIEEMRTNMNLLHDAPDSTRIIRRMKKIAGVLEEETEELNRFRVMRAAGEEYV